MIPDAELEFWNNTIVDYAIGTECYSCVKKYTLLEKLTMEMLYYGYINIMPRSYINNNNKLFTQKYLYFYSGVIGNEEIIYMLMSICNRSELLENIIIGMAFSGQFDLFIKYNDCFFVPKINMARAAAVNGHLKMLKFLIKDIKPPKELLRLALANGHVDVFNFLRENIGPVTWKDYHVEPILNGHMNIVKMIHNMKYDMDNACTIASGAGQFEILKWLRSKNYPCLFF